MPVFLVSIRAPVDGGSYFSLSKLGLGKSGAVENYLTGAMETAGHRIIKSDDLYQIFKDLFTFSIFNMHCISKQVSPFQ